MHVPVKVEMVARQIRKDGRAKTQMRDAVLGQRVRGHLHGTGAAAPVGHLAEEALDIGRLGCRV